MKKILPRIKTAICFIGCKNHQCTTSPDCDFVKKTGKTYPKTLEDWKVLTDACLKCENPCDTKCEDPIDLSQDSSSS